MYESPKHPPLPRIHFIRRDGRAADRDSPAIDRLVITCEHGGNRIPVPYDDPFRTRQAALDSHRGFDPGALTRITADRRRPR